MFGKTNALLLPLALLSAASAAQVQFKDASGLPFFPFGFYQYGVSSDSAANLPRQEAPHGMTLTCPYASKADPDSQWFAQMDAFMDLAEETGFKVHFQLIAFQKLPNSDEVLANLTVQINRYKGHPALLAWYLADEPDGSHTDPQLLQKKYDVIKQLDANHPVSMVFCAGGAARYLNALDVIMVDPYPIPNSDASSVSSALEGIAQLGKTTIMVPQAFGGGEGWARAPSAIEERLMTYIGLLSGVSGIQYFVRNPEQGFPYAESAWSEIRRLAAEVREFESVLTFNWNPYMPPINMTVSELTNALRNSTSECKAVARMWEDRDGSFVLLAAELGKYDGMPCVYDFKFPPSCGPDFRVESMFEDRLIVDDSPPCCTTFRDTIRSHETRAYRIYRTHHEGPTPSPIHSNLTLYNPSYEIAVNPAVPDGNYPGVPSDMASTFFRDSRLSTDGRHSLRLHTTNGNGVVLKPYRFAGTVQAGAEYEFCIDVRGAKGGELVGFQFASSLFVVDGAHPDTPDTRVVVATKSWTKVSIKLKGASTAGAMTGWLSYGMRSKGDIWLDNMQFVDGIAAMLV